jgi:hypothetical protein
MTGNPSPRLVASATPKLAARPTRPPALYHALAALRPGGSALTVESRSCDPSGVTGYGVSHASSIALFALSSTAPSTPGMSRATTIRSPSCTTYSGSG